MAPLASVVANRRRECDMIRDSTHQTCQSTDGSFCTDEIIHSETALSCKSWGWEDQNWEVFQVCGEGK